MNKLRGHIVNQTKVDDLCLLEIDLGDCLFKSIIIEDSESFTYQKGDEVEVLFKPSEVVLSKDKQVEISLQNRLWCKVDSIQQGKLLSVVKLNYKGVFISSIITSKSLERLKINANDNVLALIKTNEIMLSK